MQRKDTLSPEGKPIIELSISTDELKVLQCAMDALAGLLSDSEGLLKHAKLSVEDGQIQDAFDYHFRNDLNAPYGIFAVKQTVDRTL